MKWEYACVDGQYYLRLAVASQRFAYWCVGVVLEILLRVLFQKLLMDGIRVVLETLLRVIGLARNVRVGGQWQLLHLSGCDLSVRLDGGNEDAAKCCLVCSFVGVFFWMGFGVDYGWLCVQLFLIWRCCAETHPIFFVVLRSSRVFS